jgi:hypothetical protein
VWYDSSGESNYGIVQVQLTKHRDIDGTSGLDTKKEAIQSTGSPLLSS